MVNFLILQNHRYSSVIKLYDVYNSSLKLTVKKVGKNWTFVNTGKMGNITEILIGRPSQ
jgi:hypothetical protein